MNKILVVMVLLVVMGCNVSPVADKEATINGVWYNHFIEIDFDDTTFTMSVTHPLVNTTSVDVYSYYLNDNYIYVDDSLFAEIKNLTFNRLSLYFYDYDNTVMFINDSRPTL